MKKVAKKLISWLLAAVIGSLVTALVLGIWVLNNRDDLSPWHTETLENAFKARLELENFEAYLQLEDLLFQELDETLVSREVASTGDMVQRFTRDSLSDPQRWATNWNRTYVMGSPGSNRAVLLLHGMSDSPYSMRSIAEKLSQRGDYVIGLRLPGHGTAPLGLVSLRLKDMRAAVRLAIAHLVEKNPGAELHLVGYSNGAALAVDYTLEALNDTALPRPDRLVLLSPMIAISSLAKFAVWQARIGTLLGLDKLAWNGIQPEYDPFKYNSFAVNAGGVTYRLTSELAEALGEAQSSGLLAQMPPTLTMQSAVDATVSSPAVASQLYRRLEGAEHELVLFDVNRQAGETELLSWDPTALLDALDDDAERKYTLSLVTNESELSRQAHLKRWAPGEAVPEILDIDAAWPEGVYSLSHVAVPFGRTDPLYGDQPNSSRGQHIHLGALAARGERGALRIPSDSMLRQRWNPFHEWMLERILEHSQ